MSERYSRLFTLPKNLYTEGSPVIIAAGALLKDNTTENVLVQLKIRNIGNAVIKAAKIKIQPFDTLNKKLGDEIGYTYLDLSVPRDGEFGQKTLVPLSNNETRGFEVRVIELAFKDNTAWKEKDSAWNSLNEPVQLNTVLNSELMRQYKICYGEGNTVRPMKEKDLWYCACGTVNHNGEPCHTCGKTYAELTSLEWETLKTELKEKAEAYRKDEIHASGMGKMSKNDISNYEDAIRTFQRIPDWKDSNEQIEICRKKIDEIKANREANTKKLKKTISIAAIAAAVCIVAFFVVTKVIIPNINYNAAVALMESGDYEAAITAFEAMEGYKDSTTQIEGCRYNAAVALMNSGDYEAAITAFEAMDGYKDSAVQIENCKTGIKNNNYNAAVALMENGDYGSAITAFKAMDGYKDSAAQIKNCKAALLNVADVGDTVYFGAYEQDNDTSNGKEDIEWLVLDKDGTNILVISKYALDCQPYNTSHTGVTWGTCSLRIWLNETFMNEAFGQKETAMIATATVTADKNPKYNTNAGYDTQDKVFLLSITEAEKYFSSDSDRQCEATVYAEAQGAYVSSSNGNCWWWLRSPGFSSDYAAYVINGGSVGDNGDDVNADDDCVRPAMWINLES